MTSGTFTAGNDSPASLTTTTVAATPRGEFARVHVTFRNNIAVARLGNAVKPRDVKSVYKRVVGFLARSTFYAGFYELPGAKRRGDEQTDRKRESVREGESGERKRLRVRGRVRD